jgi:exopolyphosphatase/guanosine-5'-triphosphate,3'-diphosphate pyrophosphatase
LDDRFSVNVGAVRFTEQFGLDKAVSEDVIGQARAAIGADLADLDSHPKPDAVVGMGGAVTNMTAVSKSMAKYDPDAIHGATLTTDEVDRQIELYRTKSADERRSITGLQPKRAEVILAGALNVRTILEKLGASSMLVSDRGLRHGVLMERFSGAPKN